MFEPPTDAPAHPVLWEELTWEEVNAAANGNEPGFKTIKKLLGSKEYDK